MAAEGAQQRSHKRLQASSEIKASKSNVVQQAKLLDSAGTAWHAVKYGNLEMITRLFPSTCNVYSKGPVGDNVFHIALLLNTPSTLAIAKYLVKLYGKTLVNTPYQERKHEHDTPGQYEGETALHIAVVNRDFDMVKFLIQAGAEIRARCYGSFFQLGSPVYFGEYPLSFAAATGQKDIVSYLKRHGARVNQDIDHYGNTAQHLAVWHDHVDMYDHLVEYCAAAEHVRNNRGATPLLLAATLGKLEVFQHIYNRRRKVAWTYGPVTSYSLSLYEIDTVQSSHKAFVPSAIETIVRKCHMHMIDDPLVKTLLTSKWQRFALAQCLAQAFLHLVLMVVQTFLVWLQSDMRKFNSHSRTALEIVSIVLALCLLLVEALDMSTWTLGVRRRRQLMKKDTAYCPPLYPIPGEVSEVPTKVKGGFLTRMMKGAVAEGTTCGDAEQSCTPPPTSHALASNTQHHNAKPRHAAQGAARAGAGAGAGAGHCVVECGNGMAGAGLSEAGRPVCGGGWWEDARAGCGVSGAGGPVAEGTPGLDGERQGVKFAQQVTGGPDLDDLSTGAGVTALTGQRSFKSSQKFHKQQSLPAGHVSRGRAGGAGDGGGGAEVRDIVSVGMGADGQAAAMARSPSFFVQPALGNRSSVEGGPPSAGGVRPPGLPPGVSPSAPAPDAPAAPAAPHPHTAFRLLDSHSGSLGQLRETGSMESSRTTEIRNRIRGGGGGDYQGGATMTRRPEAKGQPAEKEEEEEDERQPLHVGGIKGQIKTLAHSMVGYYSHQARDPITLVMLSHILLTLIHFITWATTYGGTGGRGPASERVQQFDDIILSLVALSGWISLLYFARGVEFAGQLAVLVELCCLEVAKYCTIYLIFNMGYTLAFYTVLRGTSYVMAGGDGQEGSAGPPVLDNIGTVMIELIRFMYGEADYQTYSSSAYRAKKAVATCYFVLYVATVLLLLANLLTAIILHTYKARQGHAQKVWLLRWASYVLRAEARMPLRIQQAFRLGEVSYDPALQARVYNHVFEVVEEPDKADEREKEVKALEQALERLRKTAGAAKK